MIFEDYTIRERQSFVLHTMFAIGCLPLYFYMPNTFGLLISPYVFYLAICPRPQYLLPVIIHIAYGSQQRSFFCMGCFFYVLFHFNELYKFKLQVMYWLYLLLFPFFIWFVFSKYNGPRYVGGIGEVTGGIGEYFVFSTLFWAVIVVKKLNRTFFRGVLVFMLFLLALLSFAGAKDEDSDALITGINMFSREVFFAMPLLVSSFVYYSFKRKTGHVFEFLVSAFGTLIVLLDFLRILRMPITFTNIGGCFFAALLTFLSVLNRRFLIRLFWPLPLFVASMCVVLISVRLVEEYGGLYADEENYEKMKITDVSSFLRKLQRKAIDDRAQVWSYNLAHIKDMLAKDPIWVSTDPYLNQTVWVPGKGYVTRVMNMGAHNTMLQLLRFYGFYGGLGLLIVFIWCFSRLRNLDMLVRCNKSAVVVLMATCLSQGVVGGHTGHYPVQLTFGPVLFACLGACWRYYYEWTKKGGISFH